MSAELSEPPYEEFASAYGAGRPVLVSIRLVADLETPVSAFLKLAARPRRANCFLLESVEGGAARGRYSMIGLDPDVIFRVDGDQAEINRDALTQKRPASSPAPSRRSTALRALIAEFAHRRRAKTCRRWRPASSAISAMTWCARWSGWRRPKPDPIGVPDAMMLRPTVMVVFDAVRDEILRRDAGAARSPALRRAPL